MFGETLKLIGFGFGYRVDGRTRNICLIFVSYHFNFFLFSKWKYYSLPSAWGHKVCGLCIQNPKENLDAILVAICTTDYIFSWKTITVTDVLMGDNGDNDNSIIILCISHLLLEAQKNLYMSLLRIDPLVTIRRKRLLIKCWPFQKMLREPIRSRKPYSLFPKGYHLL